MHFSTILSVTFAALALAYPNNVIQRDAQNTPIPISARAAQISFEGNIPSAPNSVQPRAPQITASLGSSSIDDLAARAPQTDQEPPATLV